MVHHDSLWMTTSTRHTGYVPISLYEQLKKTRFRSEISFPIILWYQTHVSKGVVSTGSKGPQSDVIVGRRYYSLGAASKTDSF